MILFKTKYERNSLFVNILFSILIGVVFLYLTSNYLFFVGLLLLLNLHSVFLYTKFTITDDYTLICKVPIPFVKKYTIKLNQILNVIFSEPNAKAPEKICITSKNGLKRSYYSIYVSKKDKDRLKEIFIENGIQVLDYRKGFKGKK